MKMLKIKRLFPLYALVVSLAIVACGGGGGGDSVAGGGIGGTGITASGAITGFGSIKLNGLVLDTTNATRVVDGVPADDDSALAVGMVVTVKGTLSADGINGTANEIVYDDDVQGPIQQDSIVEIDQTKTISVMGIQVSVNRISTVFENTDYGSLTGGDLVEVSGFFDSAGILHATRIEDKGGNEIEVKGTVGNFLGLSTFELYVDYSPNPDPYRVDFTASTLPPLLGSGESVQVKGTLAGAVITATQVEREDDGFEDVDKASIEGIVTGFNGIDDFLVAGQRVDATAADFSPAGLVIVDGMQIEAEGPIVSGVLQASKVEARGGDIEAGATVESVDMDAGSITLAFVSGSLTLRVDSQTILRDDTDVADPLLLTDLGPGDFLEIEAYADDSGNLIATEIRRDETGDDLLQGTVESCSANMLTILGIGFGLEDGVTSYEDQGETGSIDTAAEFCAQAGVGTLVQVIDKLSGSGPDGVADEAELED